MNLFRRMRTEPAPAPAPEPGGTMRKTIAEYDQQLASLQERFQKLHGEIEQCRMERAFVLAVDAREQSRNQPAPAVQYSTWNDAGFRNDKTAEFEEIFHHE